MPRANLSKFKAVILAGGKGTRLYPITREIPKPLLPVKRKPIINYLVDLFFSQGIENIAILINSEFKDEFEWWEKRYYSSTSSRKASLVGAGRAPKIIFFEERKPLGTFGGLYLLKDWLGKSLFFLTNGDELKKINLAKMAEFHQGAKLVATIALVKVPNPQDYGVVLCQNGVVQKFLEKPENPPSNYINSGLYLLSPEIFEYHKGPKFTMIEKDIFPKLAKEGKLAGFKFQGKWMDCGSFSRYETAIKHWGQQKYERRKI